MKERLEALEQAKADYEVKIEKERFGAPKLSAEFVTFWLERFRKLDMSIKEHRQTLIDTFVNAIYVYDDKLLIGFNFHDGTATITIDDVKAATKSKNGSDLKSSVAPLRVFVTDLRIPDFFLSPL